MLESLDNGPPASLLLKTLLDVDEKEILTEDLPGIVLKQHLCSSWWLPEEDVQPNWLCEKTGEALFTIVRALKPWAAVRFEPIELPMAGPDGLRQRVWNSDGVQLRLSAHYEPYLQRTVFTLDCFVRCFLWGSDD